MRSALTTVLRPFYEFVFPAVCFCCNAPLQPDEFKVCGQCWSLMKKVLPQDHLYQDTLAKLNARGIISTLVVAFYFEQDGPLQSLIHQLKYNGMSGLGVILGKQAGMCFRSFLGNVPIDGIIPVPLHRTKARERGYNQSECLCKGVGLETGHLVFSSIVQRRKYTRSQTALNVEERQKNVEDAFAIHPRSLADVAGKSFLLVDDVITTGATMHACAKTLIDHGAQRIIACAVALAQ